MCDALLVIRSPVAKHKVVLLTQISPVTDYSLNTGDWSLAMALLLPRAVSPQGRRPSLPTMPLMCLYHCHMEQLLRGPVMCLSQGAYFYFSFALLLYLFLSVSDRRPRLGWRYIFSAIQCMWHVIVHLCVGPLC